MKSLLVQGFYGERNLGDDYILYSIINTANEAGIKRITVITNGEDEYKEFLEKYPNVELKTVQISKLSRIQRIKLFTKYNYWIIGGGGLFPSESRKMALQYLLRMLLARICGVKISIYGVEFNSFNDRVFSTIWKMAFSLCSNVIVRNETNKQMINDIGYSKVVSSSDVTFALETDSEISDSATLLEKITGIGNDYIIWAISTPWLEREFNDPQISTHVNIRYNTLCRLIAKVINRYPDFTHVILPFYDSMDLRIAHDLSNMINVPYICCDEHMSVGISEKRYIFKYAKAAVCMRFHSVLFSIYHGTPFCAISYSPKTSSVLCENGLDEKMVLYGVRSSQYFYREFDINEEEFCELVEKTINMPTKVIATSKILKEKAKKAEDIIKDWLSR